MTEPALKCSNCRQAVPSGSSFCPSCGVSVEAAPAPAAPQSPRAVPPPRRNALAGPCAVLYAGNDDLDIRQAGRTIASRTGQPRPDVTRALRASRGFLAAGLDAPKAVDLAEQIERDLQTATLVLPDSEVIPLPPAVRMRRVTINAAGIRCDAYSWNNTEPVTLSWDDVFLISCGRLEVNEVAESRDESAATTDPLGRRLPALVTNTRHEYLLDLVLRGPWRRLRLDQNTAAFSLTELGRDRESSLSALHRCVMHLERYAAGVPANRGLALIAGGASETAFESHTFRTKRDFDSYTHWLMQLVRFGFPIAGQ